MEALKSFAVMLVFLAAAGFIYCFLLPSGRLSQLAKSVLSSVFLLAVLSPLFLFMGQELPSVAAPHTQTQTDHGDIYIEAVKASLQREIRRVAEAYTDLSFEIYMELNITQDYDINIEQVRLLFRYAPAEPQALANAVYREIGIMPILEVQEKE